MILWLTLFLLVVGISFILAFRSMKDYRNIPEKSKDDYGLFLIRQTQKLQAVLNSIHKLLLEQGLIIGIERLFKGRQTTLTIFGPKKILDQFSNQLNLLELEDYILDFNSQDVAIWEVGVKDNSKLSNFPNIFKNLPELDKEDQFFWQVILGARKDLTFQTQIRAIFFSKDPLRKKTVVPLLQNLKPGQLIKIPSPISQEKMMAFFRLRSLTTDSQGPILDSGGVIHLLKI